MPIAVTGTKPIAFANGTTTVAPNTWDDINLDAVAFGDFITIKNVGVEDVDVGLVDDAADVWTLVPGEPREWKLRTAGVLLKRFHIRSVIGVSVPVQIEVTSA